MYDGMGTGADDDGACGVNDDDTQYGDLKGDEWRGMTVMKCSSPRPPRQLCYLGLFCLMVAGKDFHYDLRLGGAKRARQLASTLLLPL